MAKSAKFIRILLLTALLVSFSKFAFASRVEDFRNLMCEAETVRNGYRSFTLELRYLETKQPCETCSSYQIYQAIYDGYGTGGVVSLNYYRRDWPYVSDARDTTNSYAHNTCSSFLSNPAVAILSYGTGDGLISHCLICHSRD